MLAKNISTMLVITELAESTDLGTFSPSKLFLFIKTNSPPPASMAKFFEKSNFSLPTVDLFDLAPKLQLNPSFLLHGIYNSFWVLTVMPFTWRVHVYCRVQVRRKKNHHHPTQKTHLAKSNPPNRLITYNWPCCAYSK